MFQPTVASAQRPIAFRAENSDREPSDAAIIERVQAGDVKAFATLYDRYARRAYTVALAVCRDEGRAQEAVQDAFVSLWKSRASYQPGRGAVAAWLLAGVRHRAIDLVRRDAKHAAHRADESHLDHVAGSDDVATATISRDDNTRLRASLRLLPDAQQEVIELAFYAQLSHSEIATQLGISAGTVKGRMRLGLQKLRAEIAHTTLDLDQVAW